MSKGEEINHKDECLIEAYGEDENPSGGACAADAFAGVGREEWVPKAYARMSGCQKPSRTFAETNDLAKRVRQLEKELLKE